MATKPVPEGYHSITPYLMSDRVDRLVEFLKAAFAAKEIERLTHRDGRIGHAEVRIGDSVVMLSVPRGDWKAQPSMLYLYLPDVDAVYAKAIAAGAKPIERVWWHLHETITRNRRCRSDEELLNQVFARGNHMQYVPPANQELPNRLPTRRPSATPVCWSYLAKSRCGGKRWS